MQKPIKPTARRIIVSTIKPLRVDVSKSSDDPASRKLEAVLSTGHLLPNPPNVPKHLAAGIGTSESFAKSAAGKVRHQFILHIDENNLLGAFDSYPILQFQARVYPTEVQNLETVTLRVDANTGGLSVEYFPLSGTPRVAPYLLSQDFPLLYAAIDALTADELRSGTAVGKYGEIDNVEGQIITVRLHNLSGI